jgi:hypothetical protein
MALMAGLLPIRQASWAGCFEAMGSDERRACGFGMSRSNT